MAPMEEMQSMFRCTIKHDHIAARLNLGPTFQKQKLSVLLQGQLVDQMEVLPELEEDSDSEEDVNNLESATDSTMGLGAQLLPQEPMKGYTYTPFEPRMCLDSSLGIFILHRQ